MSASAAAFFDLDKTLMEGSSAFQFGRAAYKAGCSPAASWSATSGPTSVPPAGLHRRGHGRAAGRGCSRRSPASGWWTSRASAPDVLTGILPLLYPQVLRVAYATRTPGRPVFIVTAASQELAEMLAHVLVFDGGIGIALRGARRRLHRPPAGPFTYREGKAEAIRQLAAERGIDLVRVVRLLGLRVGPADDAGRRPPGGGQPRLRAGAQSRARRAGEIMRFDKLAPAPARWRARWARWRSWAAAADTCAARLRPRPRRRARAGRRRARAHRA